MNFAFPRCKKLELCYSLSCKIHFHLAQSKFIFTYCVLRMCQEYLPEAGNRRFFILTCAGDIKGFNETIGVKVPSKRNENLFWNLYNCIRSQTQLPCFQTHINCLLSNCSEARLQLCGQLLVSISFLPSPPRLHEAVVSRQETMDMKNPREVFLFKNSMSYWTRNEQQKNTFAIKSLIPWMRSKDHRHSFAFTCGKNTLKPKRMLAVQHYCFFELQTSINLASNAEGDQKLSPPCWTWQPGCVFFIFLVVCPTSNKHFFSILRYFDQ